MNLQDYKNRLLETKNHFYTKKGELDKLNLEIETIKKEVDDLELQDKNLSIQKKIVETSCEKAREQGKEFLQSTSSIAVGSVFQDDTEVKLFIDEKSNSAASLDVKITQIDENNQEQIINPLLDGGGLNDILSLSFLISIGSTIDNNFAPYILDEPSKYISKGELAEKFAEYMKDISTFTQKQIIMSTHDEAMLNIGDSRYYIEKNPITKVSKVVREL